MDEEQIRAIVRDEFEGVVHRVVANLVVPAVDKLVRERLGRIEADVRLIQMAMRDANIDLIPPPPF